MGRKKRVGKVTKGKLFFCSVQMKSIESERAGKRIQSALYKKKSDQ